MNDPKKNTDLDRIREDAAMIMSLPPQNAAAYLGVLTEDYRDKLVHTILHFYHEDAIGISEYYESAIRRSELCLAIVERGYSEIMNEIDRLKAGSAPDSCFRLSDAELLSQIVEGFRSRAEAVKERLISENRQA